MRIFFEGRCGCTPTESASGATKPINNLSVELFFQIKGYEPDSNDDIDSVGG